MPHPSILVRNPRIAAVLFAATLANAQTGAEITALKNFTTEIGGKGFVVCWHDGIQRYDLDGSGIANWQMLDASGSNPSVTWDGRKIVYIQNGTEIWLMDSDGANRHKISKQAYAGAGNLMASSNNDQFAFISGGAVYVSDLEGNARVCPRPGGGTVDYLTCCDSFTVFRNKTGGGANLYLYDVAGNSTVIGTGCGPSFSPDRTKLSVEDDGHTGYFLKVRKIITYGGITTIQWNMQDKTEYGGSFHRLKWSNHMEWGVVHGGYGGGEGLFAWNYTTKRMVMLSFFADGKGSNGNLFVGEPGQAVYARPAERLTVVRLIADAPKAYTPLGRRVDPRSPADPASAFVPLIRSTQPATPHLPKGIEDNGRQVER